MRLRYLFLSILFFSIQIVKAQVFTEASYFNNANINQLNANSKWFDADQDFDLDYLNVSIYNKTNELYLQEPSGYVTSDQILNKEGGNANGYCIADVDGDGDLDIFVYSIFSQKNVLYRQESKGLYKKDYANTAIQAENNAFYAAFCDIDLDQDADLIITDTELWNPDKIKKSTRIFLNDGKGNFTKHTKDVFNTDLSNTRSFLITDFNKDLLPDVLLINFGTEPELYINKGNLQFEKTITNLSLNKLDAIAARAADFDNDGDEDLVIATVKQGIHFYRNDDNLMFSAMRYLDDFDLGIVENIEVNDINIDGKPDILVHCKEPYRKVFLKNNYDTPNDFIDLKLRFTKANYYSIGTKVYVKHNDYWHYRELLAAAGAHQKNVYDLHFGIGNQKSIDSIKVIWPDGTVQYFFNLQSNKRHVLQTSAEIKTVQDDNSYSSVEQNINDLEISIVADTFRVGELNSITLFYKNKSWVKNSATIELSFNHVMKIQYAYPAASETNTQSITWKLKELASNESGIITLNLLLPLDSSLINSVMKLKVSIANDQFDEVISNNEIVLEKVVK